MIRRVVENFMAAQSFTKNDLLNVKQLSGYGITCSGHGMFGAYKVEMKFGEGTSFITKVGIGHRERLQIDFVLRYFQEWGGTIFRPESQQD